MLSYIEEDEIYLGRQCFSDEATFHVCEQSTGIVVVFGKLKILMRPCEHGNKPLGLVAE